VNSSAASLQKRLDQPSRYSSRPDVVASCSLACVVWKPPGWECTLASNAEDGPFASAAMDDDVGTSAHGGLLLQWLEDEFGMHYSIARDSTVDNGLLNRLDRETSGVVLWASSYLGYYIAQLHFVSRRVLKEYVCLVKGWPSLMVPRLIDAPLTPRLPASNGELSPATVDFAKGRSACTEILAISCLVHPDGHRFGLVEVRLHSGRQHQIRLHMRHEGHELVGDALYGHGGLPTGFCRRLFLHARRLALNIMDENLDSVVPLPEDLRETLSVLLPTDQHAKQSVNCLLDGQ